MISKHEDAHFGLAQVSRFGLNSVGSDRRVLIDLFHGRAGGEIVGKYVDNDAAQQTLRVQHVQNKEGAV